MRFLKFLPLLALGALASCDPEKDENPTPAKGRTVFVINEGSFTKANASISQFNKDTKTVAVSVFTAANGRDLGDVAQDFVIRDNRGYVVVNNSNKVEVVSLPDFKEVATIIGLNSPRYFLPVSATRAYLTQWGNFGSVPAGIKVIDLTTNTVVGSIATGALPERLLLAGGRVFVANSGDSTLTVIDPATDQVTSTVPVGDAPNSLALDRDGRLWVLCGGVPAFLPPSYTKLDTTASTLGSLYSLNPATPATGATFRRFNNRAFVPANLQINDTKDQLYFRATDPESYNGGVCRLGIADAKLPSLKTPFIPGLFYGLGVDPATGVIYTGTGNFSADKMARYQPNGTLIDETPVGAGPNGFVFY